VLRDLQASGRGKILCAWTSNLWVERAVSFLGIRAQKGFFSFSSREKEVSPCRQEEGIGKHLIFQRTGKCREEGVGRCLIQPWRERCMTYAPNLKTWRHHRGAQPVLGMLVIPKEKMKLNMKGKKLQLKIEKTNA
jgi:hypothetical protein